MLFVALADLSVQRVKAKGLEPLVSPVESLASNIHEGADSQGRGILHGLYWSTKK